MSNFSLWNLLLGVLIALAIAVGVVKVSVALLKDEHRKIVGGVLLLLGLISAIFGVISVNSDAALLGKAMGQQDLAGRLAIGLGALTAIVGIVVLVLRKASTNLAQKNNASTRKCPDCAETIQADAKICRFCRKALEPQEV